MPVRKMVTRSLRGGGGVFTPKSASISGGTVGLVTKLRAALSPVGSSPLNVSFTPSGITASLTSGMPSRDTCTNAPLDTAVPGARVVVAGRLAVDQTPIEAFGSDPPDGDAPVRVRCEIGISSAIVWTL